MGCEELVEYVRCVECWTCLCFGCGGVVGVCRELIGGLDQGQEGWGSGMSV